MPISTAEPWFMPAVIGVAFVAVWVAIAYFTGYKTGWVDLAKDYRATSFFTGSYVQVGQARFGTGMTGNLNNALMIGVNAEGLRLRMIFLFRLNCPDLFVPWRDIRVSRGKSRFQSYVELQFKKKPELPLRVYGRAAQRIQALAGAAWPERMSFQVIHR